MITVNKNRSTHIKTMKYDIFADVVSEIEKFILYYEEFDWTGFEYKSDQYKILKVHPNVYRLYSRNNSFYYTIDTDHQNKIISIKKFNVINVNFNLI